MGFWHTFLLFLLICLGKTLLGSQGNHLYSTFQVHSYQKWNELFFSNSNGQDHLRKISLSAASFSKKYQVITNTPVKFYSDIKDQSLSNTTISFPQEGHYLVIFLFESVTPENKPLIIPFSKIENSIKIINLSGHLLHGFANGEQFKLDHKTKYNLSLGEKSTISLGLKAKKDKRWLIAHQQTYDLQNHKDSVLLLFPPLLSGSASIYTRLLPLE